MAKKRKSPRLRVAEHLMALGFALHEDDIHYVHGGIHKRLSDIIECWRVNALRGPDWQPVDIYSAHTLTQCAHGIRLEPNSHDSDLYGDLIATPL